MSENVKTIQFTSKEAYTSIVGLYEKVAEKMNIEDSDDTTYDCKKIIVSKDVADQIFKYYKETDPTDSKEAMGTRWLIYGPKTDDTLPEGTVIIQDGFFAEV